MTAHQSGASKEFPQFVKYALNPNTAASNQREKNG
jgi:hypothetical protein